ncbi:hypothetical protein Lnau_0651 [Legionella nautarum]|uniref:Uncharacterized protein n=1 Tax=Legionella nautarum TaxID=45070 RepID=A0A0W0WYR3_9GAMM|nr:hypothetical protein [Legionella nautarum]KTD37461.1 hypothetical protein Lnau_0651 [Legionella nautarum]
MNYKITEHYERGEEKLLASFNKLNDARLFMTKKSSIDEEEKKIIYRVYDDQDELLLELNNENIFVTHAKYAEGNGDLNNTASFIFQVMIKPLGALERKEIAQFSDKNDAHLFIACKFEADNPTHDNDLFFIFKNKILIDTLNKTIYENRKREGQKSSNNGKGSAYRLSPLSTRPTPSGGPPDYWVENGDEVE